MVALALFALIVMLGLCAIAGWTVDGRDSRYGLWPVPIAPTMASNGEAHHGGRSS